MWCHSENFLNVAAHVCVGDFVGKKGQLQEYYERIEQIEAQRDLHRNWNSKFLGHDQGPR